MLSSFKILQFQNVLNVVSEVDDKKKKELEASIKKLRDEVLCSLLCFTALHFQIWTQKIILIWSVDAGCGALNHHIIILQF